MTGYRDLYRTGEDRANAIKRELDPYAWMNNGLGKSSLLAEHSRFPWLRHRKARAGSLNGFPTTTRPWRWKKATQDAAL